ncbi:hypothetical protein [Haloferax profundi]|uniref:Uncharacterized protein n=1 Tax=Haloferax profundi TaxID=1544718 RepID=A0A0W1SNE7_9EURY|nr:hypothetical protein [Haloferax profundi]KTG27815.1 hypothetical protein AUR66_13030 [Haloferax profundi]
MSRVSLSREPWLWAFVGLWALFVSVLHFGGLAYGIYTQIWWWDLLTHSLSGFGVAGVLFLVFPRTFDGNRAPVVVAGIIFAIGAGFELYEYLFKDFWYGWSAAYYLEDTATDLVVDVLGALAFVVLVDGIVRFTSETQYRPESQPPSTHANIRSDGGDTSVRSADDTCSRDDDARSPDDDAPSRR